MFELILIAGAAIAVLALILWGRRPDCAAHLLAGRSRVLKQEGK